MSYTDDEAGWHGPDADDFPGLETEKNRDSWVEILMAQEDDAMTQDSIGWCKALIVADDKGNMVVRFVYPDGEQEVFDLVVRRSIEVSSSPDDRN